MHHCAFADLGLGGNPGAADRSAQPEFSADTRRFTPLPTAAGDVRGEKLVERNDAFGYCAILLRPEILYGAALALWHLKRPLTGRRLPVSK